MEEWYMTQDFFSDEKYQRIKDWTNQEVLDLFQYALRRGGHGANDQTQGQRDRENFLHHGFVPPKSLECLFTLHE